eukprot:4930287-Amphidinium_carterae.1
MQFHLQLPVPIQRQNVNISYMKGLQFSQLGLATTHEDEELQGGKQNLKCGKTNKVMSPRKRPGMCRKLYAGNMTTGAMASQQSAPSRQK